MEKIVDELITQRLPEAIIKSKVNEYLNNVLSPDSCRLESEANPGCELILVVPCYGERDYIFRLLQSIALQRNVYPEQFEVLIIVNNGDVPPERDEGETIDGFKRRVEHYGKAKRENFEVLELLKLISGGASAFSPKNKQEHEIVNQLRVKKMKIFGIDRAVRFPLSQIKANVGTARNYGLALAIERFVKIGRNGIVAQTDADVRLDED